MGEIIESKEREALAGPQVSLFDDDIEPIVAYRPQKLRSRLLTESIQMGGPRFEA